MPDPAPDGRVTKTIPTPARKVLDPVYDHPRRLTQDSFLGSSHPAGGLTEPPKDATAAAPESGTSEASP